MKTKNEMILDDIRLSVGIAFPNYPVEFCSIPDDPAMLGVKVFNVRPTDFSRVQDFVFDMEPKVMEICMGLLPFVIDEETTAVHFPGKIVDETTLEWDATACSIRPNGSCYAHHIPSSSCLRSGDGQWTHPSNPRDAAGLDNCFFLDAA